MALLELLPGAAPARVVAADLVLLRDTARLDLWRWLRSRIRCVVRRLRDSGGNGPSRHGRRGGLQRARLVGGGTARVVEPGPARAATAAHRPLLPAAAVLSLDLDFDVEDVAR